MSDDYAEGNDESTMQLFFKRQIYLADANNQMYYGDDPQNLVDFGFAEKRLYGRVNRRYVPVMLNTSLMPLGDLASRPNNRGGFRAVAFVGKAFKDLQLQFQKSVLGKKIRVGEKYLSEIVPSRAYENPEQLYYEYSTNIETVLQEYYVSNNVTFRNFDEFLVNYRASVRRMAPNFPFTFPAYVKSWRCPMGISGLVIEIADLNHADDQEKIDQFVNSPNWSFYLNACRTYGFSVDRRAPWRLVADIASSPMLEYAAATGMLNTSMILDLGYQSAATPFYKGFKGYLLRNYNKLKPREYMLTETCFSTGGTLTTAVTPMTYAENDLLNLYSEEFFLRLYFEMRLLEEEVSLAVSYEKRLIEQCVEIYRLYYNNRDYSRESAALKAVQRFEVIINKTYSHAGSLTNQIERDILVEELSAME